MMKHEFEIMIGGSLDDETWNKIHTVYQFHPDIDDIEGKEQVYWMFINDELEQYSNDIEFMFVKANKIKTLEENITRAKIDHKNFKSNMASWNHELGELNE